MRAPKSLLERALGHGRPAVWIVTAAFVLTVISVLDSVTDPNVTFALFYVLPVALTAWRCSRGIASSFSVLSAISWLIIDFVKGRFQPTLFAYAWNFSSRLTFLLAAAAVISALSRALARERESAREDYLTGSFNARAFHELAARDVRRAQRYGHPITLIFIDVDDFKTINDTLGHSAGDSLLRTIADALKKGVRSSDIVGRLGGDEFAILLSETGPEAARAVAAKLQRDLTDAVRGNHWPVTFSLGVLVCPQVSESVDQMIERADRLMYAAKHQSKGSVRFLTTDGIPGDPDIVGAK